MMTGTLQMFYRRLLQRRPLEVVIAVLFLLFIILFQMMAPDLFRTDNDQFTKRASRESKLTRREAIWEVILLQEEVKKLQNKVAELEAEIEALKAPPNETESLKQSNLGNLSEANLISFNAFDRNGFYIATKGLDYTGTEINRGGMKKSLRNDFVDMVEYIISQYNTNPRDGIFYKRLYKKAEKGTMTEEHFWTAMFRMIPHFGMEYQVMFRDPSPEDINDDQLYGVTITKPFQQPDVNQVVHINSNAKTINIILPLQGRLVPFKKYLTNLASVTSSTNLKIHLTVVHVGLDGLGDVHSAVNDAKKLGLHNVNVIKLDSGSFNKGLAIQRGVEQWKNGNDVMFMCDVDVQFGQDFLKRCILHTEFGKSVYFPIVFSRYNPDIVSFFSKDRNATNEMNKPASENGYWRDFGYGMYCIHQFDYLRFGGHRLWKKSYTDGTWGNEDTYFYHKVADSPNFRIVRSPDPDIFHNWHQKECPLTLAADRLKDCRSSWAISEGNHKQLGLLHLQDIYKQFKAGNHLISQA